MPVSTVLLAAVFLLCCTGALDKTCRRLRISTGGVAALAVLLAILSRLESPAGEHLLAHPAYLAALLAGLLLCWNRRRFPYTLLVAMASGVCAWALQCIYPNVYEPGLLYGIVPAVLGRFLLRGNRQGLLCVLIAPLFFGLLVTAEVWYLFDYVTFALGDPLQFDMMACGAVLYGLLMYLPKPLAKLGRAAEKEG